MRFLAVLLLLSSSLSAASPSSPATVRIARIWPSHRTAESFERISEYLNGRENPGRQTLLRTQPSARAGYYFLIRINNPASTSLAATFELQVIAPTSPEPRKYTFPSALPPGSHAFNLGLTGDDWPEKAHPVAWQLVVRGADGSELVRKQSFLWAKPDQS